jgi:hypothetical protein
MSKFLRRTHMYLALFLGPWMLGYAASTLVMDHGLTAPQAFTLEREQPYDASFPSGATPREQALQILSDLDLLGAFSVQGPTPQGRLTINRQDILTPRRIVYTPADRHVTIEKAGFHTTTFLNRFHHRRTYQQRFAADQLMAVSIDVVVVAMVFWALSGIWMWWEMKATRRWATVCLVSGVGLFAFFVVTL